MLNILFSLLELAKSLVLSPRIEADRFFDFIIPADKLF